jgi:hypothetical protein
MTGTDVATFTRERPGLSKFVLEDGVVYHTYSAYARGLDGLWGMYQWLDRAPKGRNETGVWWRWHDEYERLAQNTDSCCHPEFEPICTGAFVRGQNGLVGFGNGIGCLRANRPDVDIPPSEFERWIRVRWRSNRFGGIIWRHCGEGEVRVSWPPRPPKAPQQVPSGYTERPQPEVLPELLYPIRKLPLA